jgi:para-nitrobenzyl esterase
MKKILLAAGILCLILCPVVRADVCNGPVSTASGTVSGNDADGSDVCVWLGVPYAAPPVGALRWKAPQPAPSWGGVWEADEYGNRCMQAGSMKLVESINPKSTGKMSEDCLYLNVWRPKKSGVFPVMVWIHGGGYTGGSGNSEFYMGDRFAETGELVVVTINYRLNVFGFMAHPELREEDPDGSVGSYGSLDQVAALKWVNENIDKFGGDPENVTIFGESAGGWSICTMVATPLTKGLFQRAILESGGCISSWDVEKGYDQGREIAVDLGCSPEDISCLRDIDAKKLLKNATKTAGKEFPFYPNHDGHILTGTPLSMIKDGNYNKVSFIAGSNLNEADALTLLMPKVKGKTTEKYKNVRARSIPLTDDEAEKLVTLYPLSDHEGKIKKAYGQIITDSVLSCPTYSGTKAIAEQQGGVYYYRFDYDGYMLGSLIGSVHAMEIPFVFNSLDRSPTSLLYHRGNMAEAQDLSEIMQGYWINFVKTGDPNGPGLPDWPEFSTDDQNRQIFDTSVRTETADNEQKCAFWEEYNSVNTPVVMNLGE